MSSKKTIVYLILCYLLFVAHGGLIRSNSFMDESLLSIDTTKQTDNAIITSTAHVPASESSFTPSAATTIQSTGGVCYPLVGCFNNHYPFNNADLQTPQSPGQVNTQFLLFTQESQMNPEFIAYDDDDQSIEGYRIDSSRWLRIIVHGFVNNRNSTWIEPMKNELIKLKDEETSDVLVVDWGNGAKGPFYPVAAANTRLVGKQIAILLEKLQRIKGISYDKVHCIGHSLGAHTCGLASNSINNQMARISGLDPAGPLFQGNNPAVKLDSTDAKFVDVIHSNADFTFAGGFGTTEVSGHVDFYVNGGEYQPQCPSTTALLGDVFQGQVSTAADQLSCSHGRSHDYFTESINSDCLYESLPCDNYDKFLNGQCVTCSGFGCSKMGFHSIAEPGRGNLYLLTEGNSPFCGYQYLIELKTSSTMIQTDGDIHVAIFSNGNLLTNVSLTPKSNSNIKPNETLRQVFVDRSTFSQIDQAIIYFNKEKKFFQFGAQNSNEVDISSIRLQALSGDIRNQSICQSNIKIVSFAYERVSLSRAQCEA